MAKRTEERPFRPLDADLVQAVMLGNTAVASEEQRTEPTKTVELVRTVPLPTPIQERQPEVTAEQPKQYAPVLPRPTPRRTPPAQSASHSLAERMEREKRVLLTPSEERTLDRVVSNIGAELGTSLKLSHVLRSCIRLLINAEGELIERARATGRTVRPPNGDLAAIEDFEKIIASVLHAGIRAARPLR